MKYSGTPINWVVCMVNMQPMNQEANTIRRSPCTTRPCFTSPAGCGIPASRSAGVPESDTPSCVVRETLCFTVFISIIKRRIAQQGAFDEGQLVGKSQGRQKRISWEGTFQHVVTESVRHGAQRYPGMARTSGVEGMERRPHRFA